MSSKAPQIPSKAFSALTGDEIRQIILKQIDEQMQNDDRFQVSGTYPVVEWAWELRLKFYPSNKDGNEIRLQIAEKAAMKDAQEVPLDEPIEATLTSEHKTDQPDRSRHEFGLPQTRPERNKQGHFVDKVQPVAQRPSIEIPELEDDL